jgi:quinol monooxygenase YgiN
MQSDKSAERHIICEVRGKPEHRAEVARLLLDLVEPARDEPGCLYYDLYQPDVFYIIDGWKSQDAVDAHAAHPNVPLIVGQLTPLLSAPLKVTYSSRLSDYR